MKSNRSTSYERDLPAVLLVGGMGTRLRSVLPAAVPKPLARVGSAPFLELLVRQLRAQGIPRLIMCTGHFADKIEEHFRDGAGWDIAIEYSKETEPLGTAGAVKLAARHLEGVADFVVMNGDSFLEMDFCELTRFHRQHGGLVSLAVRRVPNAARYGTVWMDGSYRVLDFHEKRGIQESGLINAGIYIFSRDVLERIPDGPSSLEKDIFPRLLEDGIFGSLQHGTFVDIGTPEDYARAQASCRNLELAARDVSR